jgi:hypothetical protein
MARVNARARTREDRAGDPLDGLVNLFDLGIVLSVAFLLAALSSLDLTATLFRDDAQPQSGKVSEDSVIVKPGETSRSIDLQPGEKVVGRGEPVGTVYRLDDGRTVIVQPEGTEAPPGTSTTPGTETPGGQPGTDDSTTNGSTTNGPDDSTTDDDEPTLGDPDTGIDGSP